MPLTAAAAPTSTEFPTDTARALAAATFDRTARLGAQHTDFRLSRRRKLEVFVRDRRPQGGEDNAELGLGIRVLVDGVWGFAAEAELTAAAAVRAAERACATARMLRPLRGKPVELAPEPVYHDGCWSSSYQIDPFEMPSAERVATLQDWSDLLLKSPDVDHVLAKLVVCREDKFYADAAGTSTTQRRIWLHPMVTAVRLGRGSAGFQTMRTVGPPVARGWEYLTGSGWDWAGELAALPEWLAGKAAGPSGPTGTFDLVIDPTNLWLTIHESIGHATELDRVLGYEAAYAGTSFAGIDQLGTLRYGSPIMNVTADRTTESGLATIGYDDEGVATQSWDLIRDGVLVGYQVDRQTAATVGLARSNGCGYADSFAHPPVARMANVSLRPAPAGPDTSELISAVSDGVYVVGDNSWSIDMQRYNFQFTGQRFYRIRHGRLAGQLRDVAYQGCTPQFWNSLRALGGPQTYLLSGASLCGKAQPGQLAAVSHGCPAALFEGVELLNTASR
ncbi:MAG TPA: TldD/PmbA family protein [Jatrophihabitans sp.]|nr:TldD/PmbA family protein [Jatrophihabitans sp.]